MVHRTKCSLKVEGNQGGGLHEGDSGAGPRRMRRISAAALVSGSFSGGGM